MFKQSKIPKPASLDFDIFEKVPIQELLPVEETGSEIDTIHDSLSDYSDEEYNENYSFIEKKSKLNIIQQKKPSIQQPELLIKSILIEEDYDPE